MNISKELDLALKSAEINTPSGGYSVNGTNYDTYSRRMTYMLSSHKEGFHYEKRLPTAIGRTTCFDGFYEDNSHYIFVESKCHEPYSRKNRSIGKGYEELYRFINEEMAGNVEIGMKESKCGRYLDVEYFSEGEKIEFFDIKEMICHLLGIATAIFKGKLEQKQIDFIYLLYDPTELELGANTKEIIDSIYERCCYECNLIDFATLFNVILRFLANRMYSGVISEDEIEMITYRFTFALASQDFYPLLLQ